VGDLPFYRRTPLMTESLASVLATALRDNPTQRLGQLICNSTGIVHSLLFNIHDEDMIDLLGERCHQPPDAFGCLYGEVANGGCALAATADSPPPTGVQMRTLMGEVRETKRQLSGALNLLDEFVRRAKHEQIEEFGGSPFAFKIDRFLEQHRTAPS
jgi:hypothetical protein